VGEGGVVRLKIRDLRVGDGADLLTFPPDYELDDMTRHVAETEFAEVTADPDVETGSCWVIYTNNGSYGIDPDWEVEVSRP
jgi:hypothetical protein